MEININELTSDLFDSTMKMVTKLFNYHRQLNNAPKEFWQTDEESKEVLCEWQQKGKVYIIFSEEKQVGFFYVLFGGQNVQYDSIKEKL